MAAKKKSAKRSKKSARGKKAAKRKTKKTRAASSRRASAKTKKTKKTAKRSAPKKKAKAKTAKPKKASAPKKKAAFGEGNYKATREFDAAEQAFVTKNRDKIPAMGREAADALDGPEGADLNAAEQETLKQAHG